MDVPPVSMMASSLFARINARALSSRPCGSPTVMGIALSRIDLRAAMAGGSSALAGTIAPARALVRAALAATVADTPRKLRRGVITCSGDGEPAKSLPSHAGAEDAGGGTRLESQRPGGAQRATEDCGTKDFSSQRHRGAQRATEDCHSNFWANCGRHADDCVARC